MHWFHFSSVRDILHVLTVKKFVLHLAAEFLSERKSSSRRYRILHRQTWKKYGKNSASNVNPDRAGSF